VDSASNFEVFILRTFHEALLNEPASPWKTIPWEIDPDELAKVGLPEAGKGASRISVIKGMLKESG